LWLQASNSNDRFWGMGIAGRAKLRRAGIHPTRQFTAAALNAGFAPDCCRSLDDYRATEFDPTTQFVAASLSGAYSMHSGRPAVPGWSPKPNRQRPQRPHQALDFNH